MLVSLPNANPKHKLLSSVKIDVSFASSAELFASETKSITYESVSLLNWKMASL